MELSYANLQALLRLALVAEDSKIDVKRAQKPGFAVVIYLRGPSGSSARKRHRVALRLRDSRPFTLGEGDTGHDE